MKHLLFLCFLLVSCTAKEPPVRSFYYWKSTANYGSRDDSVAQAMGISHFYIHFLDIDWSKAGGKAIPVFSAENFSTPFYARQDYTPVVFITPRSFSQMKDPTEVDTLAARVSRKLKRQIAQLEAQVLRQFVEEKYPWNSGISYRLLQQTKDSAKAALALSRLAFPTEIQIDCDWTGSTRDRYFAFLRALKKELPDKIFSATIRLYPYKYRKKMGVPPVDKGLLMAYNLSPAGSPQTVNSILEVAALKRYLRPFSKYPIPLDGALPLFGWSVWLRNSEMKGILHDLHPQTLGTNYVQKLPQAGAQYRLLRDTVLGSFFLRAGDVLRDEAVAPEAITQSALLLKPLIGRLSFFHWSDSVATYAPLLQKIYSGY